MWRHSLDEHCQISAPALTLRESIMSYLGNGYLDIEDIEGDAAYHRDRVAEDFRRVGGRERGVVRRNSGHRWHLHRDQRTGS